MEKLNNVLDIANDMYLYDKEFNIFSLTKDRFLNIAKDSKGYFEVRLQDNQGINKHYRLHRIIMFINEPINNFKEMYVNHRDGNKENNDENNLEWCTRKENTLHWHRELRIERNYLLWNCLGEKIAEIKSMDELSNILKKNKQTIKGAIQRRNKINGVFISRVEHNLTTEDVIFEFEKICKMPIVFKEKIYLSKRELERELKVSHSEIQRRIENGSVQYFIPKNIADVQRLSRSGE